MSFLGRGRGASAYVGPPRGTSAPRGRRVYGNQSRTKRDIQGIEQLERALVRLENKEEHERQRDLYMLEEKEKANSMEEEARRRYKEEEAAAAALKNSLENYDMTGYDGGKRKKKKYTQKRQKKQHRRHRHRRSTNKYHRK